MSHCTTGFLYRAARSLALQVGLDGKDRVTTERRTGRTQLFRWKTVSSCRNSERNFTNRACRCKSASYTPGGCTSPSVIPMPCLFLSCRDVTVMRHYIHVLLAATLYLGSSREFFPDHVNIMLLLDVRSVVKRCPRSDCQGGK